MFVSLELKPKLVDAPATASAVAPLDDCTLKSYFVSLCMLNVTGPMLFVLCYGVGGNGTAFTCCCINASYSVGVIGRTKSSICINTASCGYIATASA